AVVREPLSLLGMPKEFEPQDEIEPATERFVACESEQLPGGHLLRGRTLPGNHRIALVLGHDDAGIVVARVKDDDAWQHSGDIVQYGVPVAQLLMHASSPPHPGNMSVETEKEPGEVMMYGLPAHGIDSARHHRSIKLRKRKQPLIAVHPQHEARLHLGQ